MQILILLPVTALLRKLTSSVNCGDSHRYVLYGDSVAFGHDEFKLISAAIEEHTQNYIALIGDDFFRGLS